MDDDTRRLLMRRLGECCDRVEKLENRVRDLERDLHNRSRNIEERVLKIEKAS